MTTEKAVRNFEELPALLTVPEAAMVLRIGRSRAYELVAQGQLPAVRLGRRVRIPKAGLAKLVRVSETGGANDGPSTNDREV